MLPSALSVATTQSFAPQRTSAGSFRGCSLLYFRRRGLCESPLKSGFRQVQAEVAGNPFFKNHRVTNSNWLRNYVDKDIRYLVPYNKNRANRIRGG